jgi:hypothetical protein
MDTLDSEKLASEKKVAALNVRLAYTALGAAAAWAVHLITT